ncbi:hypothetical protein [Moraxella marmotae]|uniref:hypothetical protein n=1 Tax=Moraxella marmotae TaxID=3344520 RepID=UPI0035F2B1F8
MKNKKASLWAAVVILNILIAVLISVDFGKKYYIDMKGFVIASMGLYVFSSSMKDYFLGKDFISFSSIKSSDGQIYRFLGFIFSLFLYIATIVTFIGQ